MRKKYAKLKRVENGERLTEDAHRKFFQCLYSSVLLALKEQGAISENTYHAAFDQLKKQVEGSGQ